MNIYDKDLSRNEKFINLVEQLNQKADGTYLLRGYYFVHVNKTLAEILGYEPHELIGKSVFETVHPNDHEKVKNNIDRRLENKIKTAVYTVQCIKKNGETCFVEGKGTVTEIQGESFIYGHFKEIQEKQEPTLFLEMMTNVVRQISEGIMITDQDNRIKWINPAVSRITGYEFNELIRKNPNVLKSDRHDKSFYDNMWNSILRKGEWEGEIWNRKKDGSAYLQWAKISSVKDGKGNIKEYFAICTDLTEKIDMMDKLNYSVNFDLLTKLPNRYLLQDKLQSTIATAIESKEKFSVVVINIDNFSIVNQTLGYNIGDQILIEIANRIKSSLRKSDSVFRFSGDDFTVILRNIKSVETMLMLVERINSSINEQMIIDRHELNLTASYGMSLYPDDGVDQDMLIKNANTALKSAKESGKNTMKLFKASMNRRALRLFVLGKELVHAMEKDQLKVYYQPQVRNNSYDIIGIEALIRWHHPKQGLIGPNEFIPYAEETGLIIPMGYWLVDEVCQMINRNKISRLGIEKVAINVSAKQFSDEGFVEKFMMILKNHRIQPSLIEVEVTETHAMESTNSSQYLFNKLKSEGISIAIDDFGTGHSSLSLLYQMSFDKLKIDKAFITNITKNQKAIPITNAIMAMAKSLGMRVLAEGVEFPEDAEYLSDKYCYELQGYHFSRPVPELKLIDLLQNKIKSDGV